MSNDPERQATQLLQCLTQDKKPLGFLLGAGCPFSIPGASKEPLIPDIRGLTKNIREQLSKKSCKKNWKQILAQLTDDGIHQPNIEDILSRVRSLKELAGSGKVQGFGRQELDELEDEICKQIVGCMNRVLPNRTTPFHNVATWIGSISRTHPVEIFTTNYDLLMEQALEDFKIPFFDGFVGAYRPFFDAHAIEFDNLPPRWARVWKIHGSINWRSAADSGGLNVWRTNVEKGGNVVIHPSHLKYEQSRKMPYLAMMDRLRKFLSTPSSAFVIIGYSFGDQHLNDVIVQSLQGTPSAAVFALMYGQLSECSIAVSLAKGRSNLTILAKDGAVTGTKEELWRNLDEKPDSVLPSSAIEWTKGKQKDDPWKANFKLGDFNCFGAFLQDISGTNI
ncbi:MAG: SIR2 family protein [Deltaproteobacteria bacterium]|nr:SIR2 family protein [Deltaproteobacteria bacterium]